MVPEVIILCSDTRVRVAIARCHYRERRVCFRSSYRPSTLHCKTVAFSVWDSRRSVIHAVKTSLSVSLAVFSLTPDGSFQLTQLFGQLSSPRVQYYRRDANDLDLVWILNSLSMHFGGASYFAHYLFQKMRFWHIFVFFFFFLSFSFFFGGEGWVVGVIIFSET